MFNKRKKYLKQIDEVSKKWCCWHTLALGRACEWYREAIRGYTYIQGAEKDFANMALKSFKRIYDTDYDCAHAVFELCKHDLARMLETLGDDGKEFHYMFSRV